MRTGKDNSKRYNGVDIYKAIAERNRYNESDITANVELDRAKNQNL